MKTPTEFANFLELGEKDYNLKNMPRHHQTALVVEMAVSIDPCNLEHAVDHYKTYPVCLKAVGANFRMFEHVPKRYMTAELEDALFQSLARYNVEKGYVKLSFWEKAYKFFTGRYFL